jgi:hypothetical protein
MSFDPCFVSYSIPPHLNERVASARVAILRTTKDEEALARHIASFEADDALFYALEARVAAREVAAFAKVPAAEAAIVAELRREMSHSWKFQQNDPIEPAQYTFISPEDVALITLYFELHKDHLDIISLSGLRGSHGASGRMDPEWRKAIAHLPPNHQRSLLERGGELCYVRSRVNPHLAPGSDEWRRIVYGASDAEMAAYNKHELAWELEKEAYIEMGREKGKILWPLFKQLSFSTQVDLLRFAKNEAITWGIKYQIDEEQLFKLMEEVLDRNYIDNRDEE